MGYFLRSYQDEEDGGTYAGEPTPSPYEALSEQHHTKQRYLWKVLQWLKTNAPMEQTPQWLKTATEQRQYYEGLHPHFHGGQRKLLSQHVVEYKTNLHQFQLIWELYDKGYIDYSDNFGTAGLKVNDIYKGVQPENKLTVETIYVPEPRIHINDRA
jgi:hypothetical protein